MKPEIEKIFAASGKIGDRTSFFRNEFRALFLRRLCAWASPVVRKEISQGYLARRRMAVWAARAMLALVVAMASQMTFTVIVAEMRADFSTYDRLSLLRLAQIPPVVTVVALLFFLRCLARTRFRPETTGRRSFAARAAGWFSSADWLVGLVLGVAMAVWGSSADFYGRVSWQDAMEMPLTAFAVTFGYFGVLFALRIVRAPAVTPEAAVVRTFDVSRIVRDVACAVVAIWSVWMALWPLRPPLCCEAATVSAAVDPSIRADSPAKTFAVWAEECLEIADQFVEVLRVPVKNRLNAPTARRFGEMFGEAWSNRVWSCNFVIDSDPPKGLHKGMNSLHAILEFAKRDDLTVESLEKARNAVFRCESFKRDTGMTAPLAVSQQCQLFLSFWQARATHFAEGVPLACFALGTTPGEVSRSARRYAESAAGKILSRLVHRPSGPEDSFRAFAGPGAKSPTMWAWSRTGLASFVLKAMLQSEVRDFFGSKPFDEWIDREMDDAFEMDSGPEKAKEALSHAGVSPSAP